MAPSLDWILYWWGKARWKKSHSVLSKRHTKKNSLPYVIIWQFVACATVSVGCFHWMDGINIRTHWHFPWDFYSSTTLVLHHYKRTTGKYLYFQWCVFVHGFVNSVTGYRNLCVFPSMKSSIGLSSYATAVIIGSKKLSKKFTSFDVESEKSQQSIAVFFFCSSSSSIDKKRLQTPTHTYGDSLINRVYILN